MIDVGRIDLPSANKRLKDIQVRSLNPIREWNSDLHRIAIVGVGDAGINSASHLINQNISGVRLLSVNYDNGTAPGLDSFPVQYQVLANKEYHHSNLPRIRNNWLSVLESGKTLIEALRGAQVVFITAGMGGETGTTISPLIAELSRDMGAFVISIITSPFNFEGTRRVGRALTGIASLNETSNRVVEINNERLLTDKTTNTGISESFGNADCIVGPSLSGIVSLLNHPCISDEGLADFYSIMSYPGATLLGIGNGYGITAIKDAVEQAITNPMLNLPIRKAQGIIFNARCHPDSNIKSSAGIMDIISTKLNKKVKSLGIVTYNQKSNLDANITLLATGI